MLQFLMIMIMIVYWNAPFPEFLLAQGAASWTDPRAHEPRAYSHPRETRQHSYMFVAVTANSANGACSFACFPFHRPQWPTLFDRWKWDLLRAHLMINACVCTRGSGKHLLASLHMILTRFEEGKIPNQIFALPGDRTHDQPPDTKAAFRVRR